MNTQQVVAFRTSEEDRRKLERLAVGTRRSVSDVLRLLVYLAQPSGLLDLELRGAGESDKREVKR